MTREARTVQPDGLAYCKIGCCAGCQDCYGMSIGCHQEPCRCDLPCVCRYADEDTDPGWRGNCQRHDTSHDQRRWDPINLVEYDEDGDLGFTLSTACDVCGETGPCGYDVEGRALIHVTTTEEANQ